MITPKREAFAHHYVTTRNGAEAARLAGYSESGARQEANRLLTNVDVRAEIERLQRERWEAEKLDREYVLKRLQELAETAKSESSRIRALELLGKSLGMFREQVEEHTTHDVSHLQEFTVSELRGMHAMAQEQEAIEAEVRVLDS